MLWILLFLLIAILLLIVLSIFRAFKNEVKENKYNLIKPLLASVPFIVIIGILIAFNIYGIIKVG
ncbi:hypothetical protein [Oceanobacillus kimchii]|uniref:Uncharacterized protein n=1 Tax=Oceanobacillus kimchii TaxID=746691 RepID=A0ABQ5TGY5_9BACI|nr:hypothetical protein [Oceanobacillus kimchii]GLO66128.1 hypothetical protein MACH08_19120 [Oceanobacillus kimchii]